MLVSKVEHHISIPVGFAPHFSVVSTGIWTITEENRLGKRTRNHRDVSK